MFLGVVVSIIQLERSVDDSETRDPDRLASQGVQGILALEVEDGKAADSRESSPADRRNGAGQSDLGRGAGGSGAVGEAWNLGLPTNGASVLAARK